MRLVQETDPILKIKAQCFDFENPQVDPTRLVSDMRSVMMNERGMGLAAPQVGISLRMFIMNATDGRQFACFNPEVLSVSMETERSVEGCLSFPNLWLKVNRPISVNVSFFNEFGVLVNETFDNLNARCYLHEIDHLDGICFVDMVGPLALQKARKKAKNKNLKDT